MQRNAVKVLLVLPSMRPLVLASRRSNYLIQSTSFSCHVLFLTPTCRPWVAPYDHDQPAALLDTDTGTAQRHEDLNVYHVTLLEAMYTLSINKYCSARAVTMKSV